MRKAKKGESQKEGQNRDATNVRSYRSRCHERKPLHHFSRCSPAHHKGRADTTGPRREMLSNSNSETCQAFSKRHEMEAERDSSLVY